MKSTLTLDIRSYTKQDILNNQTSLDLLSSLYKLELVSKINMPTRKRIWTVLSGPHVHKKSREQFEMRRYKCVYTYTCESVQNAYMYVLALKSMSTPGLGVHVKLKINNYALCVGWGIAKWQGIGFWYRHSMVRIHLPQMHTGKWRDGCLSGLRYQP